MGTGTEMPLASKVSSAIACVPVKTTLPTHAIPRDRLLALALETDHQAEHSKIIVQRKPVRASKD